MSNWLVFYYFNLRLDFKSLVALNQQLVEEMLDGMQNKAMQSLVKMLPVEIPELNQALELTNEHNNKSGVQAGA